jgi:hypothetical protein
MATFQDVPGSSPADYSVTVDWGDGSPLDRSTASLALVNGSQVIANQVVNVTGSATASHTSSQLGTYAAKVTVSDSGGASTSVNSSITVICSPDNTTDRYATAILADAPLGYWRLSDTNRCAADSSGHFNSGFANGV